MCSIANAPFLVSVSAETTDAQFPLALSADDMSDEPSSIQKFLNPDKEETPDDFEMPIWDHLEELRERVLVALLASTASIFTCFCFSKDLVVFLEAPVADAGV
jgi:sec-independent protein translocase protein TatC